ncbi:hypothetical protein N7454_005047 [Penicillium verhagenii]|nr:hypothetical protein N7454_005047 [Penicillium verhagenii]
MTEPAERIRLHISPLTPDILPAVLPASIRSTATDISYHTISTFPENSYGYVTLSKMDAEKIKKKLNGSILKGKKFKVDTARPSKRHLDKEDAEPEAPKEKKKSKKRKVEDDTLEGYELPSDRKVKRGWTEPKAAKEKRKYDSKKSKADKKEKLQAKSKYTEKSECLFRTKIPRNRASDAAADDKKAKKQKGSEDVVHEFAKATTYPSFLRSTGDDSAKTATFDEEKGWVDTTGNVKEPVSEKARKKDYRPGKVPGVKEKRPVRKVKAQDPESSAESEDWTSSSGSSGEDSDSDSNSDAESEDEDQNEASSSDDSESESVEEKATPIDEESSTESTKNTDDPTTTATESDPEPASEPAQEPKEVHPLEALFKRSAPTASEEQAPPATEAGFSFFGNNDDIESEDESRPELQAPFTPFGKRDLQDRGMRSAAPTPDTAAASRHMQWNEDEDMDDEEVAIDTPVSKPRSTDGSDETEFAKWFWENRGDNNRAWKKRRRDAAKEQRQRENRKKGTKGRS